MIHIRIEKPFDWQWINQLQNLKEINLCPPASGPEIELRFESKLDESQVSSIVEMYTGKTVLAVKTTHAD